MDMNATNGFSINLVPAELRRAPQPFRAARASRLAPSDINPNYKTNVFSAGLEVMYQRLTYLIMISNIQFQKISDTNDKIADSMKARGALNKAIVDAVGDGSNTNPTQQTALLPEDTYNLIVENQIEVAGVFGYDENGIFGILDTDKYGNGKDTPFQKADLEACKTSIDGFFDRLSDTNAQEQLQIQKTMQNYNVATSMMNSFQTMMTDMLKSIIQNIRA